MDLRLLPYSPDRDVYRLLQLDPSADRDEVVAACRRLARTFHPDFNDSPRATEEMQVVNAVRDLLTNPWARAMYDTNRRRFLGSVHAGRPRTRDNPTRLRPIARAAAARSLPASTVVLAQSQAPARGGHAEAPVVERLSDELMRRARSILAALRAVLAAFDRERCPDCSSPILEDYRFCPGCGRQLLRPQLAG
jgi:curved DNA-binding protein CbpA